ncbi:hypothetical protein [Nocardia flavorosea]|uniref:Short subunit dehydrogenase n=1 Tax=Nocardia flavorosea TaxID=53429 RepID=A0A846YSX6_9NOCA|nr:hypothetical protein [Nocardia flavorosea]NKY60568.1 hypothetical protein [Nocardia flavorosea]
MSGRYSPAAGRAAAQECGGSLPLDLTELESVRAFAAAVRQELAGTPIDALILNAGVVFPDAARRTTDGYETTFAVNHLAHYRVRSGNGANTLA